MGPTFAHVLHVHYKYILMRAGFNNTSVYNRFSEAHLSVYNQWGKEDYKKIKNNGGKKSILYASILLPCHAIAFIRIIRIVFFTRRIIIIV